MKIINRTLLLLTILVCTGCDQTAMWLTMPKYGAENAAAKKAAPVVEEPAKPVAADQVTPNNARQMAETLAKELDQADQ